MCATCIGRVVPVKSDGAAVLTGIGCSAMRREELKPFLLHKGTADPRGAVVNRVEGPISRIPRADRVMVRRGVRVKASEIRRAKGPGAFEDAIT